MSAWTDDDLGRIGAAEELSIAPVKPDGTLRRARTIWAVRAGDGVYVRAAYGPGSVWHRVARASRRGRIRAGGVERDVAGEDADPAVLDEIDAAYRAKYGRYASIIDSVTNAEARASTLRLVPQTE